jgi:hypothetical protein
MLKSKHAQPTANAQFQPTIAAATTGTNLAATASPIAAATKLVPFHIGHIGVSLILICEI